MKQGKRLSAIWSSILVHRLTGLVRSVGRFWANVADAKHTIKLPQPYFQSSLLNHRFASDRTPSPVGPSLLVLSYWASVQPYCTILILYCTILYYTDLKINQPSSTTVFLKNNRFLPVLSSWFASTEKLCYKPRLNRTELKLNCPVQFNV